MSQLCRLRGSGPRSHLALSPDEAAAAIGCARDFFDDHIRPELGLIRRGRRVFVAVGDLEKWLERSAALILEER